MVFSLVYSSYFLCKFREQLLWQHVMVHLSTFWYDLNNSHIPTVYEHDSLHTWLLLSVVCTLFLSCLVYLTNNYHFVLHFQVLIMFQINKHVILKLIVCFRTLPWGWPTENFTCNCWSKYDSAFRPECKDYCMVVSFHSVSLSKVTSAVVSALQAI